MRRAWFWLRWAARDLRERWHQVAAIALTVAIGTGVYAGVGSMSAWRQESYDESYALLHAHDLRVELAEGSSVARGELLAVVEDFRGMEAAEERLITPTQVDASRRGETILVPGRLIGVDVRGGGPHVDGLYVTSGRMLGAADVSTPAGVLEGLFVDHYALPASGTVGLAGDVRLPYVGSVYQPEYFMVTTDEGGMLAEANFAAVFVPLPVAQRIAGMPGDVNDLIVRLEPGVDRAEARDRLVVALHDAFPSLAATVTTIEDDPAYLGLYGDLQNDEQTMGAIAILIFAAAAFAAFNLTSRIVEAKRRELGVGMAPAPSDGVTRGRDDARHADPEADLPGGGDDRRRECLRRRAHGPHAGRPRPSSTLPSPRQDRAVWPRCGPGRAALDPRRSPTRPWTRRRSHGCCGPRRA